MAVVFGSFQLAADARRLTRAGIPLHLTPKAFDLLALLVDAAPRVVPKSELHARLWPDSFVADTTLVGLVKEVRRVLDDVDPGVPIIRTVNRVGYAFAAPLLLAAPAVAMPAHWLVADGRSFPLDDGHNPIGREPRSAVWLDSSGVSRRHATITIADGEATLADVLERIERGDVGVAERGERAGLTFEARKALGIQAHVGRQDLERRVPREPGVARPIHLAHAARTERTQHFVRTETSAGSQSHDLRLQGWSGADRTGSRLG